MSGLVERWCWIVVATSAGGDPREETMKKSKFTDERVAYAFRRVEKGTALTGVCPEMGVTEQTFCR